MFARIKLDDGRETRINPRNVVEILSERNGVGCEIYMVLEGSCGATITPMSADEVEGALWEARKAELELELSVREEFLQRTGR